MIDESWQLSQYGESISCISEVSVGGQKNGGALARDGEVWKRARCRGKRMDSVLNLLV